MGATATIQHRRTKAQKHPKIHDRTNALDHATRVIYRVCCLAGTADLIDKIRADLAAENIRAAIRQHDTAAVFDWLIAALSYQGISDQIAYDYMEQHGYVRWDDINQKLAQGATCPKLKSYWHFHGCQYNKLRRTCTEPDHIARCPLPTHDLRNGRLNQTAYCLYLFIRDIAGGDLVGWIDQRLQAANGRAGPDRLTRMLDAVIAPLREIYGVSDKVLTMALSSLLLGAPNRMRLWREVGASMIAVKVYKASSPEVADVANKLPIGRLYANGRGFVPNVRQTLYSEVIVALAAEPQQAAVGTDDDAGTPVARGLPRCWDEIAPGHLVVAQESLANGWWEAIVIDRKDDMLTLRFRDYPRLPKFFRHRTAVALMSPASAQ